MQNKFALAYARVSTLDQAESDLSIPAQLREISKYAEANNIEILHEYVDEGISAYNDEAKRIEFNRMIEHAISSSEVSLILVHEASRFYRNKYRSAAVKGELRKFNVSVITTNSPYDPNTIDGIWRESIDETIAQTTSMQIAFHTIKGMKENAEKRDPETGYCYKNGGRAPYGYSLKSIPAGKDKKGKMKNKLLWEINPETAEILRKIVVDWRIGERLSYKQIRERLNDLNIPGPEKEHWGTSTIREMLVENRLMQYAGFYYWNKEDHKKSGKRYKDKSEWITVENAHPAILTIEEVNAALAITKNRQPRTSAARSYDSPWLLTGLNLEGQPFFTCKECGKTIRGISSSKKHIGNYGCSTYHNYGKKACSNNKRIGRLFIERRLLEEIEKVFGTPNAISSLVTDLNNRLNDELKTYDKNLYDKKNELAKIENDIELAFSAYLDGIDKDICNEQLARLKSLRSETSLELEKMESNKPQLITIDLHKVQELFNNLKKIYDSGTNEQKRTLFKTYIRNMELDPELDTINIVFYPPDLHEKIKRGEDSPRYLSSGVGRGT